MKKKVISCLFFIVSIISISINIGIYSQYKGMKNDRDNYSLFNNYLKKISVDSSDTIIYNLDEEFKKEMDNTNGVTSKIIEVLTKYSDLWEKEMNNYYSSLLNVLNNNKMYLIQSQKSWEIYSNNNNQLIYQCNILLYGEGSYLNILKAEIVYQKYRQRAIELKELCTILQSLEEINERNEGI